MLEEIFDSVVEIVKETYVGLPIFLIYFLTKVDRIRKYFFERRMFKKLLFVDKSEEFENVYNQVMNQVDLNKVATERKKVLIVQIIAICSLIFFILGFSLTVYLIILDYKDEVRYMMTLGFSLIFLFIFLYIILDKKKSKHKDEVIKFFLTIINPKIRYNDWDNYSDLYVLSGFKDQEYNRKYVTDFIQYELNYMSKVSIADFHLQNYTRGSKRDYTDEVYEGLITEIIREKQIDNEILIERNKFFKSKNRVKNENLKFERIFDVYAKDTNTIDMYITEDIKEQFLELYKKYGIMFEISINKNKIYIRFFCGGLFEYSCFGTWFSKKKLYREYIIFTSILDIIEKFNEIM